MNALWKQLFLTLLLGHLSVQGQLSSDEKDEILNLHNRLRGNVNPPATNMLKMVWNVELASVAQSYSSRCEFEHNPSRSTQSPSFSYVGENIAYTTGATDYTNLVELWYNEVADYTYSSNSCAAGKVCGHYTQVVWANSRSLGCGATRCSSLISGDRTISNGLLLVCNYGPGGNFAGQSPYSSGTVCSACPSSYPHCVEGTCSDSSAMITMPGSTSQSGSKDPLRGSASVIPGVEGMCPSRSILDAEIDKLKEEIARNL